MFAKTGTIGSKHDVAIARGFAYKMKAHGRQKSGTAPASTGNPAANNMTYIDPPTAKHPHRETTEKDRENTRRIESVMIHQPPLSFEEMVEEYQKIEVELVEQAGDDEFDAIETKRRIAEWILTAAFMRDQPFEVCKKSWNHLLDVGFSSLHMKCSMSCLYADCCWENKQDEVGLVVVEPVIVELEQWLAETTLEANWRADYERILANLKKRRDKLRAGIRK